MHVRNHRLLLILTIYWQKKVEILVACYYKHGIKAIEDRWEKFIELKGETMLTKQFFYVFFLRLAISGTALVLEVFALFIFNTNNKHYKISFRTFDHVTCRYFIWRWQIFGTSHKNIIIQIIALSTYLHTYGIAIMVFFIIKIPKFVRQKLVFNGVALYTKMTSKTTKTSAIQTISFVMKIGLIRFSDCLNLKVWNVES